MSDNDLWVCDVHRRNACISYFFSLSFVNSDSTFVFRTHAIHPGCCNIYEKSYELQMNERITFCDIHRSDKGKIKSTADVEIICIIVCHFPLHTDTHTRLRSSVSLLRNGSAGLIN